jgi:adenosylcobinamide kinase/adenosylcobinamide-phosphate guanylyltransferase
MSAAGAGGSVLVIGGARNGKSRYAVARALALPPPRVFVATAEPRDADMAARIAAHRVERGDAFATVEEPRALAHALAGLPSATTVIIVDCVTLWIANLLATDPSDHEVEQEIDGVAARVASSTASVIVVSNEVGSGIVPFEPETRRFRDLLGVANQRLAAAVENVVLMVAGIPVAVKPSR